MFGAVDLTVVAGLGHTKHSPTSRPNRLDCVLPSSARHGLGRVNKTKRVGHGTNGGNTRTTYGSDLSLALSRFQRPLAKKANLNVSMGLSFPSRRSFPVTRLLIRQTFVSIRRFALGRVLGGSWKA